jgi:hypothetical protein
MHSKEFDAYQALQQPKRIDPAAYRALAISTALRMYARTGIKANTQYTPAKMMKAAEQITGRKFKARQYILAAMAIREKLGLTEQ